MPAGGCHLTLVAISIRDVAGWLKLLPAPNDRGMIGRRREGGDPFADEGDFLGGELRFLFCRHVVVAGLESLKERAFARPAWDDDRAIGAAGEGGLRCV